MKRTLIRSDGAYTPWNIVGVPFAVAPWVAAKAADKLAVALDAAAQVPAGARFIAMALAQARAQPAY